MKNIGTIFRACIVTTLLSLTLTGCSNSNEESAPADSSTSNNWSKMEWDKGTWAN